jgi:hypothetical protein
MMTIKGMVLFLQVKAKEAWIQDDPFRLGYEQALRDVLTLEEENQTKHEWEFYMIGDGPQYGSFCKKCGAQLGSGQLCR